jgi:hypothetical protein
MAAHAGADLLVAASLLLQGHVYPPDVQGVDGGSACCQPLLQKTPFVRFGGHDVMRNAAQRSDSAPQSDILQVQQRAAKCFAHKRQADSRPAQAWDRELNEFTS